MKEPTGKTAMVTGGAQGIGKAIVQRLLNEGMNVIILDRDPEAGHETEREYRAVGPVRFFQADVSEEESIRIAIREVLNNFSRIDALINNAAIVNPVNQPVEFLELADWNRVLATNLTGCLLCVKHAVPHLRKQGGVIVNIASTRALQSERNTEAYAASKGGLVALTHALAVSLGPDIRVNCISPGWIETGLWKKSRERIKPAHRPIDHEQHPAGRVGEPQDIASLVAFLISNDAGFITGQNYVVDGGMTRKMIYAE